MKSEPNLNPESAILPTTTLRDVFEHHFGPTRLHAPARNTIQKYREAIKRFDSIFYTPGSEFIRLATVADLTPENMELMLVKLLERFQMTTIQLCKRHITTLWWYLADLGIVTNAPPRRLGGRPPSPKKNLPVISKRQPPRAEGEWTNDASTKRTIGPLSKKRRLTTVPQAVVEKLLPTDSLKALVNAYILRRLRGATQMTAAKFLMVADELEFLLDRPALIEDLSDEHIENVMYQVLGNGRSIATANSYRAKLVSLANFAAKRGILKVFPDVEKLVEPHRIPIGWTLEELGILFRACREQRGTIGGIPACDWMTGLHAVLYDTAERVGAVMQARWENLDWTTRRLVIVAEMRKGKTEDKSWRLHPDTMEFLRRIRMPERELIFPWFGHRSNLWLYYGRMLERAGLAKRNDRKRKFHCMRKTAASFFAAAGGDAVALLGHSGPNVTKAYMVPEIVQTRQACDVLVRPVGSSPVSGQSMLLLEDSREPGERQ